jgi:hypothetical protein
MRPVVPRQIVALIDRLMPIGDGPNRGTTVLQSNYLGPVSAVLDLVDRLPPELVTLQGEELLDYLAAVACVRGAARLWASGMHDPPTLGVLSALRQRNPMIIVRDALDKCPDDVPAPATQDLAFIDDGAFRELLRRDISGARRALSEGHWKMATVLCGSIVEALLLWTTLRAESKTPGSVTQAAARATIANAPKKIIDQPDRMRLFDLIQVTLELGVLRDSSARVADGIRDFRNLIHPAVVQRSSMECGEGTAHASFGSIDLVVEDIKRWFAATP